MNPIIERMTAAGQSPLIKIDQQMINRFACSSRGFGVLAGPGYEHYVKALGAAHAEASKRCLGYFATDENHARRRYFVCLNESIHAQLCDALAEIHRDTDRRPVSAETLLEMAEFRVEAPAVIGGVDDVLALVFHAPATKDEAQS